jgi:Zn-dependent peptidase ImmA (M78 family)/transcriptional regulator with XRE-family HTH domain
MLPPVAKPTLIPVTPSVLTWAVKESGYGPATVAAKVGVPPATFAAWLRGDEQPRLSQFRKLANALKRTPATLLLSRPPQTPATAVAFRGAPGAERSDLLPTERRYLREARRLQNLARWLQTELGEEVRALPHFRIAAEPETVAEQLRLFFPAPNGTTSVRTPAQAFRWWRGALERRGVLVFGFPLGRHGIHGFSLPHETAPVVAFNTWWRNEVRSFTLFHEFGHLLTRTASACLEAGPRFARPSDSIERWCEQFSAALLLPREAVQKFLTEDLGRPATLRVEELDVPTRIASRFKVSLRAATLRLIEMKLAAWDLYAQIPPVSENKPPGGGGRGRERGEIREGQYGDRTVGLIVRALNRDVLGRTDVLDVLNISDGDLSKLERKSARTA